jgi:hypothetical protein
MGHRNALSLTCDHTFTKVYIFHLHDLKDELRKSVFPFTLQNNFLSY